MVLFRAGIRLPQFFMQSLLPQFVHCGKRQNWCPGNFACQCCNMWRFHTWLPHRCAVCALYQVHNQKAHVVEVAHSWSWSTQTCGDL